MLTAEENEALCRVGPGTPMGKVLRRYWTPAFQLGDLPAPDCPPIRVTILGENFVAFRDTEGKLGFLDELLPPRRLAHPRPGGGLRDPVPLPRLEVRRGRDHHGDPQPRHRHLPGAGQARGLPGARGGRARLGLPWPARHRAAVPELRLGVGASRTDRSVRDHHGLQLDAGAGRVDRLLARGHPASRHARHHGRGTAQRGLIRLRRGTVGPGHAGARGRPRASRAGAPARRGSGPARTTRR